MKGELTWLFQAQYMLQIILQLLLIIQSRTFRLILKLDQKSPPAAQLCGPDTAVPKMHPAGRDAH